MVLPLSHPLLVSPFLCRIQCVSSDDNGFCRVTQLVSDICPCDTCCAFHDGVIIVHRLALQSSIILLLTVCKETSLGLSCLVQRGIAGEEQRLSTPTAFI